VTTRRIAGALCFGCGRGAQLCVDDKHRELAGVVEITPNRWICAECARTANAQWIKAARALGRLDRLVLAHYYLWLGLTAVFEPEEDIRFLQAERYLRARGIVI
jgi:hypothetical protein